MRTYFFDYTPTLKGNINLYQIEQSDFIERIEEAQQSEGELISLIRHEKTAGLFGDDFARNWIAPRSHERTPVMADGDTLLIARYITQGEPNGNPAHYEYFFGRYTNNLPVPPFSALMAMDIYEHSGFVYLKDLYLAHGGDSWEQILKARKEMKALSDADQEQWRYLDNLIREYLRIEFDVSGLLSEHGRKLKG